MILLKFKISLGMLEDRRSRKSYIVRLAYAGRTSEELDVQLALLYGDSTGDLNVSFSHIQQQRGGADCGLFAAAVCLALATGVDPETIQWRQ